MSASTRGPLETKLMELLPTATVDEVQELVTLLLDATREDMYENLTFQGKILPGNSQ